MHDSGASRREIADVHLKIECRLYAAKMDCFASLAMTALQRIVFGCLKIESAIRARRASAIRITSPRAELGEVEAEGFG
jgi:hypothetical protein